MRSPRQLGCALKRQLTALTFSRSHNEAAPGRFRDKLTVTLVADRCPFIFPSFNSIQHASANLPRILVPHVPVSAQCYLKGRSGAIGSILMFPVCSRLGCYSALAWTSRGPRRRF